VNEKNDILKELEDLGSPLARFPRTTPYLVPDGYFDQLSSCLLMAGMEQDAGLPFTKMNAFTIPEGYFGQFPVAALEAAKAEHSTGTKVIPIRKRPVLELKWAAAAILIACVGMGVYNLTTQTSYERELSHIPEGTIYSYVQQHMDESELSEPSTASIPMVKSLDNEEIIQYLDETGWD